MGHFVTPPHPPPPPPPPPSPPPPLMVYRCYCAKFLSADHPGPFLRLSKFFFHPVTFECLPLITMVTTPLAGLFDPSLSSFLLFIRIQGNPLHFPNCFILLQIFSYLVKPPGVISLDLPLSIDRGFILSEASRVFLTFPGRRPHLFFCLMNNKPSDCIVLSPHPFEFPVNPLRAVSSGVTGLHWKFFFSS